LFHIVKLTLSNLAIINLIVTWALFFHKYFKIPGRGSILYHTILYVDHSPALILLAGLVQPLHAVIVSLPRVSVPKY
jgi:hypothetical protein